MKLSVRKWFWVLKFRLVNWVVLLVSNWYSFMVGWV